MSKLLFYKLLVGVEEPCPRSDSGEVHIEHSAVLEPPSCKCFILCSPVTHTEGLEVTLVLKVLFRRILPSVSKVSVLDHLMNDQWILCVGLKGASVLFVLTGASRGSGGICCTIR